jgi:hypothetical protein
MPSERVCNRISLGVLLILSVGIAAGIALPAGPGWDFANFYDAGHKILAGQAQDLYDAMASIEGSAPEGHLPYYGVPLSAVLLAPLAWLRPGQALTAFKIQNTAAILLGLWLLYRWHLPRAAKAGLAGSQYRALFLAAVLLFQPFWTIYRVGGQTTPTLFLGFVLALMWFTSGRPAAAAACLVCVIAIKPAFVLPLAVLTLFGGARFFAWTAVSGTAAAAVSILAMGWPIHAKFLEHIRAAKISPWIYNSSLSVFADNLYAVTGPDSGPRLAGAAVRVGAAALVVAALVRERRQMADPAARRQWTFLTAIAAGLALMPIVWEHYLSVLFLPAAYLLARLPRLGRPAIVLLAAACGFCVTQNLVFVLWLNQVWSPHGVPALLAAAVFKSAPLILFTVLLWRHREPAAAGETTASPIETSVSA